MTEVSDSNTYDLMSRSVASVSENCTFNLSSPGYDSGVRNSGGMVGSAKGETIGIGDFGSGRTCRSNGFLRTRVSPDERPRGTRIVLNFCKADDS